MKRRIIRLAITTTALLMVATPIAVSAHQGHDDAMMSASPSATPAADTRHRTGNDDTRQTTTTEDRLKTAEQSLNDSLEQAKQRRQAAEQMTSEQMADLRQKLDNTKKKLCDNHESQINKVMDAMDTRRQNAFDRISQVSDATQRYVDTNHLSVSGYDDLVAAVSAAKAAAQSSMQSQQAVPIFTCSGDHPRLDISDFRAKRSDSIDAMKAYRSAVKQLIAAVKTAHGESKS